MRARLLAGPFLLTTVANFFFFLNFASYFLLPLHIRALGGSESVIGLAMGVNGLASLSLFGVGAMLSLFTGRSAAWGGLRMLAIGAAAGAATWGIGRLLGVSLA